jgi:uncharacterized membrane protein YpjA
MVQLLRWTLAFINRYALIFWACVVANLVGVVVGGWFWYGPMIVSAPFWAVPFIPDCPGAALLGTIALIGIRYRRGWGWFNALAAFGCIKYGVWTIAFWLRHWSGGGEIEIVGLAMFVVHIGLLCEGLLFLPHIGPLAAWKRIAVIGFYALSAFIDYGLVGYAVNTVGFPFYPPLTPQVPVSFALAVAAGMIALLGAGLLALPYGRSEPVRGMAAQRGA